MDSPEGIRVKNNVEIWNIILCIDNSCPVCLLKYLIHKLHFQQSCKSNIRTSGTEGVRDMIENREREKEHNRK